MSTFYQHFGANLPTPNINISGVRFQQNRRSLRPPPARARRAAARPPACAPRPHPPARRRSGSRSGARGTTTSRRVASRAAAGPPHATPGRSGSPAYFNRYSATRATAGHTNTGVQISISSVCITSPDRLFTPGARDMRCRRRGSAHGHGQTAPRRGSGYLPPSNSSKLPYSSVAGGISAAPEPSIQRSLLARGPRCDNSMR